MEEKKKLLSKWDKIWIFVVVLIIAYVVLQKFGIYMVQQTEDTELIQRPHQD